MKDQEEYDDMFDFTPNLEHDSVYDWLRSYSLKESSPRAHAGDVYKHYKIVTLSDDGYVVDETTTQKE
jgi:hypothetical protein